MSYKGDGYKLVGDDGFLMDGEWGAEVIGDASAPLSTGTFMIISVATVSTFPAAITATGADPAVGDIIVVDENVTITPAVGDNVVTLTLTDRCDVKDFSMGFSKNAINVSTQCDVIETYRAGRADMTGTVNGVFTLGSTDQVGGMLTEFMPMVRQDGATSMDRYSQAENILVGKFFINKSEDRSLTDDLFVIAAYQLYNINLGAEYGSEQAFSAEMRFAPLSYTSAADVVVPLVPTFHRIGYTPAP